MENGTVGIGDALLMMQRANGGDQVAANNAWMNNPFLYLIFLAMFGGGNFFGNRNGSAVNEGEITRAEMYNGLDNQDIKAQIRGIANGISSGFSDVGYALNNAIKDQTFQIGDKIAGLGNAINDVRFANQQGQTEIAHQICETNHNIDNLKFIGEQNTCRIENAIHSEGEQTRALLAAQNVQQLRDVLADKDRELLYYKLKNGECNCNP